MTVKEFAFEIGILLLTLVVCLAVLMFPPERIVEMIKQEPATAESTTSASYEYRLEEASGEATGLVDRDPGLKFKCPCGSTTFTAPLGETDIVTCAECGKKCHIVVKAVE